MRKKRFDEKENVNFKIHNVTPDNYNTNIAQYLTK